jgi:small subunit ribosomal protein S17
MSEDDKKATEETPKDEGVEETPAQDEGATPAGPVAGEAGGETAEGSDAEATGPVAEEGTPSSQAAEGEPTSTPPVEDESEADDAPAVEEKAGEAESDPEDGLPWKEKRRLQKSRRPHKAGPAQTVEERKAARAEGRKRHAAERRKERGAAKAKKVAGTGTPPAEKDAVAAKARQGIVVSDKGQKTIVVRIDTARRHPTYEKVVRRSRTLHAHDERNEAGEGDVVRVIETRPLSKTKRWRLVEILEKAK